MKTLKDHMPVPTQTRVITIVSALVFQRPHARVMWLHVNQVLTLEELVTLSLEIFSSKNNC